MPFTKPVLPPLTTTHPLSYPPPPTQVHYLYFGNKPSPRRRAALAHMHPLGLTDDWADKLKGQSHVDDAGGITYEHYMQVWCAGCSEAGCAEVERNVVAADWLLGMLMLPSPASATSQRPTPLITP